MVEGAAFTKFAVSAIFAWLGLIVRVNGTKGGLSEVLRERVIWLSELRRSMGELAVLLERAYIILKIVLAHLGLIFLLKCIELALVSIKVIVVRLLSEVLQNLTRWVVKVSWSSLRVQSFSLILRLWLALRVE